MLRWADVINDKSLRNLPYKIEMDRRGRLILTPASNRRGMLKAKIGAMLGQMKRGGQVLLGSTVVVPFGRSKRSGYVIGLAERSERCDLKEVISVVGKVPLLTGEILKLARWMGDYYCAPVEHAVPTREDVLEYVHAPRDGAAFSAGPR